MDLILDTCITLTALVVGVVFVVMYNQNKTTIMDNNNINAAADYVRDNLERWEINMGWHYIGRREPIPTELEDKIYDLLEEFGDDNDLPECWWEEFGDIEDVFMLIENN